MKYPDTLASLTVPSPLGPILLAATEQALVGLWFDGQRHQPDASRWHAAPGHPVLTRAGRQLGDYLAGRRQQFRQSGRKRLPRRPRRLPRFWR